MLRIKQIASGTLLRRLAALVVGVFVSLAAVGCVITPPASALAVIDQAIADLEADSSAWRSVLNRALDELPDEAQETIRRDLQNLLDRTIDAAGAQFRCNVDFLGDRALEGLYQIRADILGEDFQRTPAVCGFTPKEIDLDWPSEKRKSIHVSGYNFDTDPPLSVTARTVGGKLVDLSDKLKRQTHYWQVLNLSAHEGFELDPDTTVIDFVWKDETWSVPVLAATPRECAEDTVTIPTRDLYNLPPHTGQGDKEFFGNVDITVRTRLLKEDTGSHIDVELYMYATQPADDHTTAEGTVRDRYYTALPGQKILYIVGPVEDEIFFHDGDWEEDVIERAGSFVNQYVIHGDSWRDDAGIMTDVTAYFNPVQVRVIETGDCV